MQVLKSTSDATPHEQRLVAVRRGRLRNGNRSGDFMTAPRCGAMNRQGSPCQCPAMRNGRCRLHGGLSTGPRTPEGLQRIRIARTKHGWYTAAAKEQRRNALWSRRELIRRQEMATKTARSELREFKLALKAFGL
jgi:hypothetical protein